MKTLTQTFHGLAASLVTVAAAITPANAFNGDDYYFSAPGPHSAARALNDYLNSSNWSGLESADTMAAAWQLYSSWNSTAPNYALGLYYNGVADANASFYYDLADTQFLYKTYFALYVYTFFVSAGYPDYAATYYQELINQAYADNSSYYSAASSQYETYGSDSYYDGVPTGYAGYYFYIYDQYGF